MTLRLITFDLDDTLWDAPPVLQAAEAALQRWLAEHAPRLDDEAGSRYHIGASSGPASWRNGPRPV